MGRSMMRGWMGTLLGVWCLALVSCGACDAYEPRDAPLPSLPVTTLEGTPVDLAALRGHPVVLHLWLPS